MTELHPSLTRAFYEHLEHAISAALRHSRDKSLRRYWCDGILEPEWPKDYQPESVRTSGHIVLRAWIDQGPSQGGGSGAQSIWQLVVKLGLQAYQVYLQGRSLEPCVPASDSDDWILIDPENRMLEVQLL
ncbi:hypothetical protein F0P96_17775 [Hymenobacter busanensis]|uniref:Uncharacterized protein n=1 Tax=Hymenobacter busanensis TaxID=2607656 RepID=A0A7L5A229_9BACT|nr:hypothetical protein [Hymenobacter busanensis]KAA9327089.1 hypothetical protein F0P96_17775 [Hymenobacter busanensis]QHJ09541.1 hypothetical protein GUY19_20595 [Hymenobacter busanensis]